MTPSPVSGLSAATRLGAILANDAARAAARRGAGLRIGLQRRQRGAVRAQARERRPFGRERLARAQALFERERGDRLRRGGGLLRDLPRRHPRRPARVSRFPGPPRSPEPKPWPLRRAPLSLPPAQRPSPVSPARIPALP